MSKKQLHLVIYPSGKHWVGNGFYVSTMISPTDIDYRHTTPFVLLDHASPKVFEATENRLGVGEHPHRGFETVTFAINGEVEHRDSGGGGGVIRTGGVQWMTAGSGVVHEEFHSKEFSASGGEFEMVQLWVNLPAQHKLTQPRYQSLDKEDFPSVERDNATIKLIAGHLDDLNGPAESFSPILIYELTAEGASEMILDFQEGHNVMILQLKKGSSVEGRTLKEGELAIFERDGSQVALQIDQGGHLLVLSGQPIDEPLVHYGPFVMNTKEEIIQAMKDYEEGKMGSLVMDRPSKGA